MRQPAIPSRQRIAAMAGVAASLAGLAIVSFFYLTGEASHNAQRAALAAADDDAALTLLRSWADDDGDLSLVVECLGDERSAVAKGAEVVLHERLTAWQALRSEASSPKIAWLARALVQQVENFTPAGRAAASALAQRMLEWPLADEHVDPLAVIADCEAVLRATAARPDDLLLAVAVDDSPADAGMMIGRRDSGNIALDDVTAWALPGGGLPWETIELPPDDDAPPVDAPQIPPTSEVPTPFDPPGEIYAPLATPLELLKGKARIDDRTADERGGAGEGLRRLDFRETLRSEVDEWTLFKLLHNPAAAPLAEAELLRRGHNASTLAVARKMTDADPHVRRELAEALPQLAGIDPQPWLVQLARDDNAEVRRTAISIIASSGDASVTRWLSGLRETERDPHVAELIDELLGRRQSFK